MDVKVFDSEHYRKMKALRLQWRKECFSSWNFKKNANYKSFKLWCLEKGITED